MLYLSEYFDEFASGFAPVRHKVFILRRHLGERYIKTEGLKHRVVAKSFVAASAVNDSALAFPFHEFLLASGDESDVCDESRVAVSDSFEVMEQQTHVSFRVVARIRGITGSMHSGSAAKSLHFKPRVVGETVNAIFLADIARLLQRVSGYRVGRLGNIFMTPYLGERHNVELIARYLADFAQFVRVVSGNKYFSFSNIIVFDIIVL